MTESPHVLRRLLVLAAVAGLLLTPMVIAAQTRTPDLVSIYVGMPSMLQKQPCRSAWPRAPFSSIQAEGSRRLLPTR